MVPERSLRPPVRPPSSGAGSSGRHAGLEAPMTSWWSATAGALVVVAALGNGSRLFIPHPNQERQISSWTPADSSARALRTGQVFLFDSRRQAVAYLEQDGSRTIYLW